MEEAPNIGSKNEKDLPLWLKRLKTYGLGSIVAMSSFLASCENSEYDVVKDYRAANSKEISNKDIEKELDHLQLDIDSFYNEVQKIDHYSNDGSKEFNMKTENWSKDSTGTIQGLRSFDIPDSHDTKLLRVSKTDSSIVVQECFDASNSHGTKGFFTNVEFIIKGDVYNKISSSSGAYKLMKILEEAKDNNAKVAFIDEVDRKVKEIRDLYHEDNEKK